MSNQNNLFAFCKNLCQEGNNFLIRSGNIFQMLLLLFFRLNWGWQLFVTGKGKLLNHQKVVEYFSNLSLPFPDWTAWFIGLVECVGGLFLIAGLAARPLGLILVINMIVAYLVVEDSRQTMLNFFKDQTPFLQADPFFFLLTALLVFAFGAGRLSLDALLAKIFKWKEN